MTETQPTNVLNSKIVKNPASYMGVQAEKNPLQAVEQGGESINKIINTFSNVLQQIKSIQELKQQQQGQNTVGQDERVKTVTEYKNKEVPVLQKPKGINEELVKQELENVFNKAGSLPEKIQEISIKTIAQNGDTFNVPFNTPLGKIDINKEFIKNFVVKFLNENINKYLVYENETGKK